MSEPDQPDLSDVLPVTENAPRDRQEHGKMPAHPNDDVLAHRAEHEQAQVDADQGRGGASE